MVTTVEAAFRKFSENLEITTLQRETTSTRQQQIRAAVENGMTVLDSFLTGSYSRHTMIAPLNKADIDIFIVLAPVYFQANGQKSLLDTLKAVLKRRYPSTPEISRNGQAVTITFSDFVVDVVPSFHRQGGGYLIPDAKTMSWISTNPKQHVEYKTQQNDAHNGNLVPLIKMIKCWNRNNNYAFESFYLELLVAKILSNVAISNFPSGCRYFFDKGRESIRHKITDPVPYGNQINGLRTMKTVDDAVALFQKNYNDSLKAERMNQEGNISQAIAVWRSIFGDYFPSYSGY